MPIDFRCSECQVSHSIPDNYAGKQVYCPDCQAQLHVPMDMTGRLAEEADIPHVLPVAKSGSRPITNPIEVPDPQIPRLRQRKRRPTKRANAVGVTILVILVCGTFILVMVGLAAAIYWWSDSNTVRRQTVVRGWQRFPGIRGRRFQGGPPPNFVEQPASRISLRLIHPPFDQTNYDQPADFLVHIDDAPADFQPAIALMLRHQGKQQLHELKSTNGGFHAKLAPIVGVEWEDEILVTVIYAGKRLHGTTSDRTVKIGNRSVSLTELRTIWFKEIPEAVLIHGETIKGAITGFEAWQFNTGKRLKPLSLDGARVIHISSPVKQHQVEAIVQVQHKGIEVGKLTTIITIPHRQPPEARQQSHVLCQIEGAITPNDPIDGRFRFKEAYYDTHTYRMQAGQTYRIEMTSVQIDSFIVLVDDRDQILMQDDDSGGNLNSLIEFQCPRDGAYRIVATSFDDHEIGNYTLRIQSLTSEE